MLNGGGEENEAPIGAIYSLDNQSKLLVKMSKLTLNIGKHRLRVFLLTVNRLWSRLNFLFEISVDVIHVVLEASERRWWPLP